MRHSLKKQGFIAFAWDFAGKLANQGMGLIVSIFLARLLEPAEFGLLAMVMVFVGIAAIFTDIGLGSALIQKRRLLPIHYSSVFFFNIALGSFFTIALFVAAPYLAQFYNNPAIEPIAKVLSLSFIIDSFGAVQGTKLRKELNYAVLTKARFTASAVSGIVGITMAFNGFGVWSLVAQALVSQFLYVVFIWSKSGWAPNLAFSFKALKKLWAFGFRMFLSGVLDSFFSRLDYMLIGKLFPAETLGYFQRAKSLNMLVVKYSSGSLMSVMFPLLSQVQHDLSRFRHIVNQGLGLISFIVFLLLGSLYVSSHEIILLLFGEKWQPSVELFQILALSGFGYPISALLVNVLSSRGNSKDFLKLEIYKKILIPFNLLVLYFFGIFSFLYFRIFTSFLSVLLNALFVKKEIRMPIHAIFKPIFLQATIALISVFAVEMTLGNSHLSYVIGLFLKSGLFLLIYWFFNKITQSPSYLIFAKEAKPMVDKLKKRFLK